MVIKGRDEQVVHRRVPAVVVSDSDGNDLAW